jgi:N-acetylglucosaminyldiphosphoundecaprenol N-acetyl-beta-D-mannosaminyltransferase
MKVAENRIFSIKITYGSFKEIVDLILGYANGESRYVCISNVHMLVEAAKDPSYAEIVLNADLVTADGVPLIWALKRFKGIKQERVSGMDILPTLIEQAEALNIPVFFYGGSEELMAKTRAYISNRYSNLIAGFYNPPFRALTPEEEIQIIKNINDSGAKIVFVVLGCPKQEKWMSAMKGRINAIMLGVGGALPVLIGEVNRAPKWMQKYGLEWMFRLINEPGRLLGRYVYTNSFFIYLVARETLKNKLR